MDSNPVLSRFGAQEPRSQITFQKNSSSLNFLEKTWLQRTPAETTDTFCLHVASLKAITTQILSTFLGAYTWTLWQKYFWNPILIVIPLKNQSYSKTALGTEFVVPLSSRSSSLALKSSTYWHHSLSENIAIFHPFLNKKGCHLITFTWWLESERTRGKRNHKGSKDSTLWFLFYLPVLFISTVCLY